MVKKGVEVKIKADPEVADEDASTIEGTEDNQPIEIKPVLYKKALEDKVAEVNGLSEAKYTDETWSVLADALALPESTQDKINDKITAIQSAIEGLVEKEDTEVPVVIESLETPVSLEVFVGEVVALPAIVTANMSNETTEEVSVTWEPTTIDTSVAGTQTATGTVEGFDGSVIFAVIVKEVPDTIAPVISYDGPNAINLEYGKAFTWPEVTATDNVDGDVVVTLVITFDGEEVEVIDTEVAGTYTITYSAVDTAGNEAEDLVITVVVKEKPAPQYASTADVDFDVAVDFRTSEEDAKAKLVATVDVIGSEGEEGTATIEWTIAGYEAEKAGTYIATGVLTLPEGWEGSPDNISATVTVEEEPALQYASTEDIDFDTTVDFGTEEYEAIAELVIEVAVTGTKGEEGTATIEWTITDYNGEEAGIYTATGVLTLPEGWEGTVADVTATVTVEAELDKEINSVGTFGNIDVDYGTELQTIELPETVEVTLDDNSTATLGVEWDGGTPEYNGNVAGTYEFKGTIILTDGIANPEEYTTTVNVIVASNSFTQSVEIDESSITLSFSNSVLVDDKKLIEADISSSSAKKDFFKDLFDVEGNEVFNALNFDYMNITINDDKTVKFEVTENDGDGILSGDNFRILDEVTEGELRDGKVFLDLNINTYQVKDEYNQNLAETESAVLKMTSYKNEALFGELINYKEGVKKSIFLSDADAEEEKNIKTEITLDVQEGATKLKATVNMSSNNPIGTDIAPWSGNNILNSFTKDGAFLFVRLYKIENGEETPIFFNTVFEKVNIAASGFGGLNYVEGTGRLHGDFGTGNNGTQLFANTRIADSKYAGALHYNSKLDGSNVYPLWLPEGSRDINITNDLKEDAKPGDYVIYMEAYGQGYKDAGNDEKWGPQDDLPLLNSVKVVEFTIE